MATGLSLLASLMIWSPAANALPSYATQTGQACAACHEGSLGPQLTQTGRNFKLLGYAEGPGWFPIAGQAIGQFTNTNQGQEGGAAPHFSPNHNSSLNETSIFYAGRIVPNVGAFVQVTYDGVAQKSNLDQLDIRFARGTVIAGTDVVYGLDVNNNPTTQDLYNTTPVWRFPYTTSGLAPAPGAATQLEGGIEYQAVGLTAYTMINDLVYLEAGGYKGLGAGLRRNIGEDNGDRIGGFNPYWRLAIQQNIGKSFFHIGTLGLHVSKTPGFDSTYGNDSFTDYGFDGSWQYTPNKRHHFSTYVANIYERQHLNASVGAGAAGIQRGFLNSFIANSSYYYAGTYGLTGGYFAINGKTDPALYTPGDIGGSATGSPNSSGYILQADWTPLGKKDSFLFPYINFRLGAQFTHYLHFNGAGADYNGDGRNANKNDTFLLFLWLAY
jgi:hypothetical protein